MKTTKEKSQNIKSVDNKITKKELQQFKHIYIGRVQFSEVDSFGVVHNLQYFYWLEWARTDYLRQIGLYINPKTFLTEHPFMTVHAEIDYFLPSKFNDNYNVYTRISKIGNSSLVFENVILNDSLELLVKAKSILVNTNPGNMVSERISNKLRKLILDFESNDKN